MKNTEYLTDSEYLKNAPTPPEGHALLKRGERATPADLIFTDWGANQEKTWRPCLAAMTVRHCYFARVIPDFRLAREDADGVVGPHYTAPKVCIEPKPERHAIEHTRPDGRVIRGWFTPLRPGTWDAPATPPKPTVAILLRVKGRSYIKSVDREEYVRLSAAQFDSRANKGTGYIIVNEKFFNDAQEAKP